MRIIPRRGEEVKVESFLGEIEGSQGDGPKAEKRTGAFFSGGAFQETSEGREKNRSGWGSDSGQISGKDRFYRQSKDAIFSKFLNDFWWRQRDSNPRPQRCERCALSAELCPHRKKDGC